MVARQLLTSFPQEGCEECRAARQRGLTSLEECRPGLEREDANTMVQHLTVA